MHHVFVEFIEFMEFIDNTSQSGNNPVHWFVQMFGKFIKTKLHDMQLQSHGFLGGGVGEGGDSANPKGGAANQLFCQNFPKPA